MSVLPRSTTRRATLSDLARVSGKAELVGGRIVELMPTGQWPNLVAGEIFVSLKNHARATKRGVAFTDNMGFAVPELPSGLESFSPDASYYDGPFPSNEMDFITGPPTFAAQVRSKNDYGPAVEDAMARKREDYFLAGTLVVWDMDPLAPWVWVYRASDLAMPTRHGKGEQVDAEPAVPGWRLAVDDLFP